MINFMTAFLAVHATGIGSIGWACTQVKIGRHNFRENDDGYHNDT